MKFKALTDYFRGTETARRQMVMKMVPMIQKIKKITQQRYVWNYL